MRSFPERVVRSASQIEEHFLARSQIGMELADAHRIVRAAAEREVDEQEGR